MRVDLAFENRLQLCDVFNALVSVKAFIVFVPEISPTAFCRL